MRLQGVAGRRQDYDRDDNRFIDSKRSDTHSSAGSTSRMRSKEEGKHNFERKFTARLLQLLQ